MPWKRKLMHTENEGNTTPWRKSPALVGLRAVSLEGKGASVYSGNLCRPMWLEKSELRDPGGTGEHGSLYELRLWSQTTRMRPSPSSTSSWLNVWARSSGLYLHKSHRTGVRSQYILKHWAQSKNLAYVIKCLINCSCIIVNITIRQADLNECTIASRWDHT